MMRRLGKIVLRKDQNRRYSSYSGIRVQCLPHLHSVHTIQKLAAILLEILYRKAENLIKKRKNHTICLTITPEISNFK